MDVRILPAGAGEAHADVWKINETNRGNGSAMTPSYKSAACAQSSPPGQKVQKKEHRRAPFSSRLVRWKVT